MRCYLIENTFFYMYDFITMLLFCTKYKRINLKPQRGPMVCILDGQQCLDPFILKMRVQNMNQHVGEGWVCLTWGGFPFVWNSSSTLDVSRVWLCLKNTRFILNNWFLVRVLNFKSASYRHAETDLFLKLSTEEHLWLFFLIDISKVFMGLHHFFPHETIISWSVTLFPPFLPLQLKHLFLTDQNIFPHF